ncbi:MAG: alkaline phosphatase family protein [Actinomycetota bacterium]
MILHGRVARVLAVAAAGGVIAAAAVVYQGRADPVPSFRAQACALPERWLDRIQKGYFARHSGDISILPRTPAYFASSANGGWGHSGPWDYLQRVPLVFYGPGVVGGPAQADRAATLADVAPTLAALLKGSLRTEDGEVLEEVARIDAARLGRPPPRVIVVVVWDGGGWNTLDQWPDAWPNLKRIMDEGVSYTEATVGSSPSVTPSVHTTLGTGVLPYVHGITGIPLRSEDGTVVDAFVNGESSRFIQVPALAERWDELHGNSAEIGMVGYEPWHLGMIGQGAERPGGDRDDAVWLDTKTNEWITNPKHYRLPPALATTTGLQDDIRALDAADGEVDGAWGEKAILDDVTRREETPAFIVYHTRAMINMMRADGYGKDAVTDLVFTNYKQIDRLGHYFNMASNEVRQSVEETDRQLGVLLDFLDREVGRERWAVVVTADHGQQPDEKAVGGYGIDPGEVVRDIDRRFGEITDRVPGTEVFLKPDALERTGVTVDEVARFLGDYRLQDNAWKPGDLIGGSGALDASDRLFELAIPSDMLDEIDCGSPSPSG